VIKVAFTSSDGRTVDEHFGQAKAFHVWQVAPDGAAYVGRLTTPEAAEETEDRILERARLLDGCAIVCTGAIGGPAAAKLVSRHIHPMKMKEGTAVEEVVQKLRDVLSGRPPPWLRKAMGRAGRCSSNGSAAPAATGAAVASRRTR
jgi:nitrogen fixation protein NifX